MLIKVRDIRGRREYGGVAMATFSPSEYNPIISLITRMQDKIIIYGELISLKFFKNMT